MNLLILMMSLIGSPIEFETDLGTCKGVVVAPGVATLEGTCELTREGYLSSEAYNSDESLNVLGFSLLESKRVIVRFGL